ncbi:GNAT family N-acetyltransferase [Limosilactobacillus reuteri]|nr:GNAT family N-acetyltransferase [Limosilactobacillus reuteri]
MRKVILFIALSLDGYIADKNGGVDWIHGHSDDSNNPDTYSEFIKDIDTVLMGWNTYHQVRTELSPNKWVYEDLQSYVFTHRQETSIDNIHFVAEQPVKVVKQLKQQPGKDIWICGGASLVQQLAQQNLIDEYYLTIVPTLLGQGIRLFNTLPNPINLQLIGTKSYNGFTELRYQQKAETTIRKFKASDLDQVMEIWLNCNIEAHPFVEQQYWREHFQEVRKALLQSNVLVAENGDQLIGFAGLQENYLAGIFIKKEFRSRGIGSQLLTVIQQNYASLTLHVYVKNESAYHFYQQHGLKVIKKQIDETGNEEYMMQWNKNNTQPK